MQFELLVQNQTVSVHRVRSTHRNPRFPMTFNLCPEFSHKVRRKDLTSVDTWNQLYPQVTQSSFVISRWVCFHGVNCGFEIWVEKIRLKVLQILVSQPKCLPCIVNQLLMPVPELSIFSHSVVSQFVFWNLESSCLINYTLVNGVLCRRCFYFFFDFSHVSRTEIQILDISIDKCFIHIEYGVCL